MYFYSGKDMYYKEKVLYNEKASRIFIHEALYLKGGGYLLSRIALQYHRRKQA